MNSVLNPEAPEFYPHLKTVTKDGYTKVNKTIRTSNHMPSGNSYDLFKTFTDFNKITKNISKNVVEQTSQILTTELPAVKLRLDDREHNSDKIIDANDCVLDRININLDTVSGVNDKSDQFAASVKKAQSAVPSNDSSPVVIQMGSTTFIGAKNIPRPQFIFKDTIDNSESLWVPKISDKPNNIKPLALNILYNDDGEAVGYEHPYQVELDLYHPPSEFIDPDPEPPSFPPGIEDTSLKYIETEQQMDDLVKHLYTVKELAIDLEHHSYRTYQGITCLIQISTMTGGDFIVDALAAREHVHKLNVIFTDPKKVKVLHGSDQDILWLQRDFGVYIVGLFDTYKAGKALQLTPLSLKHLLVRYCQVDTDKRYQLADWRMRPLPEELTQYARMDTHYLLYIWRKMKAQLLDTGGPQLLLSVFEQSRQLCGTTYNKDVIRDNSHLPLYVRSKKSFNSKQMAALKMLYKWRDAEARNLDESTAYLLPNHMLLLLAETLPREMQGVHACCSPMPPFIKQNLVTVHRMILTCRELPLEPQLYQMPAALSSMTTVAHQMPAYAVHDLAQNTEYSEDHLANLDKAVAYLEEFPYFTPEVAAMVPSTYTKPNGDIKSDLNAEAKLFFPPYDRYRKYRALAQVEEIKEFKDKSAKIAALGKGNELIKEEIIIKLQQAKSHIENNEKVKETPKLDKVDEIDDIKQAQRKRKMSADKTDRKKLVTNTKETNGENSDKKNTVEPYSYNNANYKKFFKKEARNQRKMKFNKKHK